MPLWLSDAETKALLKGNWEHIESLGLHDDIRNAGNEDQQQLRYLATVIKNAVKAERWLEQNGSAVGDLDTLIQLHQRLFHNVHPARETELREEEVLVGNKVAIPPEEIPARLQELNEKLTAGLEEHKEGSRDKKAEVLAEYHCGLKEAQLFMDGNGRTARLFLDHQLDVVFGTALRPPIDSREYESAMHQAISNNNTAPMTALISEVILHSVPTPTKPHIGQQIEFTKDFTKSPVVDF